MAEYPSAHEAHPRHRSTLSIPFLLLSAVLCGVGIFGTAYWLVTQNWFLFASLIPLVIGAYMLFTRGTGPDRA